MSDVALAKEIISQMLEAIERINRRFADIQTPDDFVSTNRGLDMLDSIAMMLITLGESCKNLDKITDGKLLSSYPEVDWKGVKGMRDIISHHYFDINAELVFNTCKNDINSLGETLSKISEQL